MVKNILALVIFLKIDDVSTEDHFTGKKSQTKTENPSSYMNNV